MKKTLSFLFVMYFISLAAVHNQFPIGLYSCLRSTNYTTLIEKAENANMNMVGIRYNQIGEADYWDAIDLADSKQMDVRIYDDIEFADGGTYHLGGCNHFWYDAENSLSDLLSSYYSDCPDYWFYGLRALDNNTGAISSEDYASGDPLRDDYPATAHKAWHCSETAGNQPGWAVRYLAYKEEPLHSVSSQVHIPSGIDPDDIYFYFDFALKFVNSNNASDDTPVCRLEVVVRDINDPNIFQYDNQVTLHPVAGANYDHILTVGELEANAANPYYTFYQFYSKWDEDFPDDILMNSDRIAYIAFRIWWYGVGDLKIDGMQIEDNLFRQLENGDYDTAISSRMNQYNGYDNINHFYSYDEPQPPQYRSFKNIQDNIQNYSLATAVMRHDKYARYKIFDYLAEPDLFMEDFYPLSPGLMWNTEPEQNPDEPSHVQHYLNILTSYYRNLREYFGPISKPWYAVIQAYGNWEREYDNEWQGRIMPPSKTLKSLAFLPLCYDTDGLVYFTYDTRYDLSRDEDDGFLFETQSFMFDDFRDNGFWDIKGLLEDTNRDNQGNFDILTDQYYAVQQANSEIESIAPIIQNLTWLGANHDNDVVNEGSVYQSGLVSVAITNNDSDYDGFVEIGVYENELAEEFYFMLVNRRANIIDPAYDNGLLPLPEDVDTKFTDAYPQDVVLSFENLENDFVLVDQYTGEIYDIDDTSFATTIEINPGDGMLLKLCQLPVAQEIYSFNSCTISDLYIPYDITVKNTGQLNLAGDVEFGPNASLIIETGGTVNLWGETLFGRNAEIIVEGTLNVNNALPVNTTLTSKYNCWQGIECLNEGLVNIQNESIIEDAEIGVLGNNGNIIINNCSFLKCDASIAIYNGSTLEFTSSDIELKDDENSKGIIIVNTGIENNVSISGTETDSCFISSNDNIGLGAEVILNVDEEEIESLFEYVEFENLETGIKISVISKTENIISQCSFENCTYGIYLSGAGSMDSISDCSFYSCIEGVHVNTAKCLITECEFNNCGGNFYAFNYDGAGVVFDNTSGRESDGPHASASSLLLCNFSGSGNGVKCINATPRISHCVFDLSILGVGLEVYNNSCIDLSWTTNNTFSSNIRHIIFNDSGLVNLLNGHNDFQNTSMIDIHFLSDYQFLHNTINFNGNYWQDRPLEQWTEWWNYIDPDPDHNGIPSEFIIADYELMDDYPNCITTGEATSRYEEAGLLESEGENESALTVYENILTDLLLDEKPFWKNCVDRVFILSIRIDEDIQNLIDFYENLNVNLPDFLTLEEKDEIINFVKNYQKKVQIELENFQEAADLVIERIDDPTSSVDSLFAVMELENIYYIASMGNGRSLISTSYQQHNPQNFTQLQTWQDAHWDEIYALLGKNNGNNIDIIPPTPKLFNNYPNPFNPETTISFSIPEVSKVKVSIYNIKGQKVKTLLNSELEKGMHDVIWKSKDSFGKSVASGVYFYQLKVNGKNKGMKKMLLLK